jgi:predicted DNA-binding protein
VRNEALWKEVSGKLEESLEGLWLAFELARDLENLGRDICRVTAGYARQAIEAGRREAAAAMVERALKEFPDDPELLRARGILGGR